MTADRDAGRVRATAEAAGRPAARRHGRPRRPACGLVIAAATAAGSTLAVAGSTSTRTGRRAQVEDGLGRCRERVGRDDDLVALDRHRAPRSARWSARSRAVDSDGVRAPTYAANAFSNSSGPGPVVSQPDSRTASAASRSAPPIEVGGRGCSRDQSRGRPGLARDPGDRSSVRERLPRASWSPVAPTATSSSSAAMTGPGRGRFGYGSGRGAPSGAGRLDRLGLVEQRLVELLARPQADVLGSGRSPDRARPSRARSRARSTIRTGSPMSSTNRSPGSPISDACRISRDASGMVMK